MVRYIRDINTFPCKNIQMFSWFYSENIRFDYKNKS